ncbi:DUF2946 domain-containing protein [Pseudoduganella violaceinigra]|uniref:DUF2946 domain-containing protein n=1 Tax=Pseudoduganella violaceinigra TaxID=246602 RepID=UPI00047F093B|nr:DUF2946 domain-containing protein [Pseudoduganella violaceinigra]
MKSSTRLRWIWIACFAILMNALAPAISHAVNSHARTWEICLNDGTRVSGAGELDEATFAALTDRSKPRPAMQPMAKMDMEDCAYCLPHAGSFGLPPSTLALPLPLDGATLRPTLFYQSPQPLPVWSASNPRGPPAHA